jgi:excisionase family DNA binding protein
MEDMLYTVPEVAAILKTNVDYVYKLQKAGLIKFMKIGRLKCRKATLEAFLEKYDGCDISNPFNVQKLEEGEVIEEKNEMAS